MPHAAIPARRPHASAASLPRRRRRLRDQRIREWLRFADPDEDRDSAWRELSARIVRDQCIRGRAL
jgi:hypothetical protein